MSLFNQIANLGRNHNNDLTERLRLRSALEKYEGHKAYFEVKTGSHENVFGSQNEAQSFAKFWNGFYQVVIYIFENGQRVRKVIYEKQY